MNPPEDGHDLIEKLSKLSLVGEQHMLCQLSRTTQIDDVLPQVVCLMFSGQKVSLPVYELLRTKATRSLHFRLTLFFTLKSILSFVSESSAAYCYFLCCDLLDVSMSSQMTNTGILLYNYWLKHPKGCKLVRHARTTFRVFSAVGARMGNVRKTRRRISRTFGMALVKSRMPCFEGLWVLFARAISSLTAPSLFYEFDEYLRTFTSKKNFKNLTIEGASKSSFKQNILFYTLLVEISNNLKKLPSNLRQRALEVELELTNMKMLDPLVDPFYSKKVIVNILVEECSVLNSAENAPYMIVAEVLNHSAVIKKQRNKTYCKAAVLWSHLNSLNKLGDVGDMNGIRENIFEALEKMLFAGVSDAPLDASVLEQESRIREEIEETRNMNIKSNSGSNDIKPDEAEDIIDAMAVEMESQPIENSLVQNLDEYDPYNVEDEPLLAPRLRTWDRLKAKVKDSSPLSGLPGWDITTFIVKHGSSLKMEYLASQIITEMKNIFIKAKLPIFLNDYKIFLISEISGFVETVKETVSIHKIKTEHRSLLEHFKMNFRDPAASRRNFLSSLVGYSLAAFLLQLKDRHNGNILIDGDGHIIHVDFAFILGKHPGFYCVENAPFKFSDEYLELIDLDEFRRLFHLGFVELSNNLERIAMLVEIVEKQGLCDPGTVSGLRNRMRPSDSAETTTEYCKGLVDRSIKNMRTIIYDKFQYFSNGYY